MFSYFIFNVHLFCFLGDGVFLLEDVQNGQFLCEYPGELITKEERMERDRRYTLEGKGSYIFDFEHKKKMY